jgi:hypothetical protein
VTAELARESAADAGAKAGAARRCQGIESNTVILNGHNEVASVAAEGHRNVSLHVIRKGVFQRIGHQFIDDQPDGRSRCHRQQPRFGYGAKCYRAHAHRPLSQIICQTLNKGLAVDIRLAVITMLIQTCVNPNLCYDPV